VAQVTDKAVTADMAIDWTVEITTYIPVLAPNDIGLKLTVISLDKRTPPVTVTLDAVKPPQPVDRVREDSEQLPGRLDTFTVKLPKDFKPAAVKVLDLPDKGDAAFQKTGKFSRIYFKLISLQNKSSAEVRFVGNTYISAEQGERLFVREDALTNTDLAGNEVLAELINKELQELRGEGANKSHADNEPRKDPDRIYRYATYNDLGGDIKKNKSHIRDTLGGTTQFPYPRRLATNRGYYDNSQYEKAPDTASGTLVGSDAIVGILNAVPLFLRGAVLAVVGVLAAVGLVTRTGAVANPWTPQDDNFDTDKTVGFIGGAVSKALPSVLAGIDASLGSKVPLVGWILRLLGLSAGPEFESEAEVLSLYDKAQLQKLADKGAAGAGFAPQSVVVPAEGSRDIGAKLQRDFAARRGVISRRSGTLLEDLEADVTGGPAGATSFATGTQGQRGAVNLLKYDVPKSIQERLSTWSEDEEFGRLFLAGQNPMVIEVLDSAKLTTLLADSPGIKGAAGTVTGLLEGQSLDQVAASGDTGEPRLFLVDYWVVSAFFDELQKVNVGSNRVMHAGRCVLFRNSNQHLVPVIIELAHSKTEAPVTYTPNDPAAVWQVAKAIFQSVDSVWHQLISHWLRTHACVEPYLIATRRHLPAVHPIFKLILPHFRYTLPINAAARGALVNADGVIETNFSPGPFSMALSSKVYGLTWRFKEEGLLADLKKRGFLDASGKLRVHDYPYAEDGLLIWGSLSKYFTQYVDLYYTGDQDVVNDSYLQDWWSDVTDRAHGDAQKDGWLRLDSKSSLVTIITTIAWVASGHHAAVNFGQYDYSGWMPPHSSLCRRAAPAPNSKEWEILAAKDVSSPEFFSYMAPPATTTKVMTTIKLLSAHAEDEQYLSTDRQDWLPLDSDPKVKALFKSFITEVAGHEAEITRRNNDPKNISRNPGSQGMAYTLLLPSSEPGVTMRGVPYSISI